MLVLAMAVLISCTIQMPELRGIVRAGDTGNPLPGAIVEIVGSNSRTWSDSTGSYRLALGPPGTHHLRVSRVGYVARALDIVSDSTPLRVDIALVPQPLVLALITVVDTAPRISTRDKGPPARFELGERALGGEQLRASPALIEADALRALTMAAHATALPDAATSLHVRGGAADENRVLLDGVPIYNPYHAAGTLTAVNPDVISAVTLHAGVPSAQYGDALSSVIALSTDAPDSSHSRVRGGIGPSGVRQAVDVPLTWPKASLLVAGRHSVGDLYTAVQGPGTSAARYSDFFARATARLGSGTLKLFSLRADDRLVFDAHGDGTVAPIDVPPAGASNQFAWSSRTHAGIWSTPSEGGDGAPPRAVVRGWYSSFDASAVWDQSGRPIRLANALSSLGLSAQGAWTLRGVQVTAGAEGERLRGAYRLVDDAIVRSDSARPLLSLGGESLALSAFAQGQWSWSSRWTLSTGARARLDCVQSCALEPRLAVRFRPSNGVTLSAGFARMHQRTQSLRNDESLIDGIVGIALPVIAQPGVAPLARSDQFTAAMDARLPFGIDLTLDGYVRHLSGLLLVAPSTAQPFAIDAYAEGSGAASGVGVSAVRYGARTTTSAAYSLATTTRVAGTTQYRPAYGPAQTLTLWTVFQLARATTTHATLWGLAGRPATASVGEFDWSPVPFANGAGDIAGSPQQFVGPLGGTSLPAYWRLDAGVRHAWHPGWSDRFSVLTGSLAVTNVLNRVNAFRTIQGSKGTAPRAVVLPPRSVVFSMEWKY
jgi:hypothetical protein